MFPKYYSRRNNFGIQNKSLVDLAYREWIFNIKNKPQVAKDPNKYIRPEKNINEFEQVPMKEKETLRPLQKFFLLPRKNNNKKKTLKQIKPKNKWTLNRKENKKP